MPDAKLGSNTGWVFCTSCGVALKDGWQFCPSCGNARVEVEPAFQPEPARSAIKGEIEAMLRGGRIQDAMARLDQAVELEPRSFALRMLRAQLLARVGLHPQALADLTVARAELPPGDVTQLLKLQELDRLVRERSKGNFVRQSELPRLPGWLKGLGKRGPDVPARAQ
jgi:uncharacterized Zn finger protein (UPF0148 family)